MTTSTSLPSPFVLVLLALAGCVASSTGGGPPAEPEEEPAGEAGAGAIEQFGDPVGMIGTDVVELDEAPEAEALLAQATPLSAELPEDLVIPKRVVGADTRTQVPDTRLYPHSTVAMLLLNFGSQTGMCTGSLIASDAVLTAAHCVYDATSQRWATNIRVVPGAYAGTDGQGRPRLMQPFGSASGRKLYAPSAYRTGESRWARAPHDYAVLRYGNGLRNNPGTRALGVMAAPSVGTAVTLVAFHGDKCVDGNADGMCNSSTDVRTMQRSGDSVRELLTPPAFTTPRLFNHYADSFRGSSGGPLVSRGAFANTIFAIHIAGYEPTTETKWNMGLLLTDSSLRAIEAWTYDAP